MEYEKINTNEKLKQQQKEKKSKQKKKQRLQHINRMESSICFINILTQRLCIGLVGMHYRYCDDNPEATSWSQINLILYFPLVCFRHLGIKIIDQSLVRLHTEKNEGLPAPRLVPTLLAWPRFVANFASRKCHGWIIQDTLANWLESLWNHGPDSM